MSYKRADRVSEAIKREISVLILQEVKDPDVTSVTVMDVKTTDDLRHARVFVSVMGDETEKKKTLAGLERAKGFLRAEVSHRLGLRYAPEIQFCLDTTLDHAMRIEEILTQIKAREAKLGPTDPSEEPGPEAP